MKNAETLKFQKHNPRLSGGKRGIHQCLWNSTELHRAFREALAKEKKG